ncbi:MAG: DUF1990 domain-containing protein [Acidimicrobiales bacterium]|nr:DUF1990 domain-containing protein [Acidimicrobiales bacterium]
MLRIRRPTSRKLAQIARECEGAPLTYEHVGATLSGDLPSGYVHDDTSVLLGTGAGVFEAARSSLQNWAAHRGAGLVMSDGASLEEGTTVALTAPLPVAHAIATCRIVRVVDEPNRYGFAYGTLPLHPEDGEEAFLIERDGEDVRFRIVAFSRPRFWAARMARPIARRLQVETLHDYLRAMQRAVS